MNSLIFSMILLVLFLFSSVQASSQASITSKKSLRKCALHLQHVFKTLLFAINSISWISNHLLTSLSIWKLAWSFFREIKLFQKCCQIVTCRMIPWERVPESGFLIFMIAIDLSLAKQLKGNVDSAKIRNFSRYLTIPSFRRQNFEHLPYQLKERNEPSISVKTF